MPSVIAIHSFLNQAKSISKQPAVVTGSTIEVTSNAHSFIVGNKGRFLVGTLILNDGKGVYKNEGEFNADFFTLNQNTFTNSGQMDVAQFKGDKGTLVNHGILSTLEKSSFNQFENRGTAVLEELDISEHGGNQGTLTLKSLSGSGIFTNQGLLIFEALVDNPATINIRKFINQSEQGKQAEVKGENIVVSKKVTEFLLNSGTFIAHSLSFKSGDGYYENRGDLILMSLLLDGFTISFLNKGNLQVKTIAGKGTFINYHLLTLKYLGQQSV